MISASFSPLTFILGFIFGIGFIYFLLRFKGVEIQRLDERFLSLRLPLLGVIEAKEKEYKGIFVKAISEALDKIKVFQNLVDFDVMLRYANNYNINYIGTEGDLDDNTWSKGRLAYSTLSKGYNGGYNIYLNPTLDRKAVCHHLSDHLSIEIKPDELYTFLFLHEIGHTKKAGNECYISAVINHSLSGGRRSVRRRRELKALHSRTEKFADEFAVRELLKLRYLKKLFI
jgi:hypothetical protein